MQTLQIIFEVLLDMWDTGNYVARYFVIAIIIWPALMIIGALVGSLFFNSLLVILPIVAGLLLLVSMQSPLIIAAVAGADQLLTKGTGRSWLSAIVIVELMLGIYLSVFRIANDRLLIPLFLSVIVGLIILALLPKGGIFSFFRFALWLAFFILTAIFILGGREKIKKQAGVELAAAYPGKAPIVQVYAKKPSTRFEYQLEDGSTLVKLDYNCDREEFFAEIPPLHKVEIHHVYFDASIKRNRCSYNVYGDSYPVSGPANGMTKDEFKNDLPAPEFIAHKSLFKFAVIGKEAEYRDFKRDGDMIVKYNCSPETMRAYAIYNISKGVLFSSAAQQIGYDGSTASFEGRIEPVKPGECS